MATILCIEDDNFIADIYVHSLKKAGYEVDVVADGTQALNKAKQNVYDVILLDLMLPETSGVEILKALRNEDGSGMPHTKIIVTTNFDEPEEDKAKLERMADGYLIKADVTPSRLVELIGEILKQPDT